MKWSLSEIKKHAKRASDIHTSIQVLLSKAVNEYTDKDENELASKWVPLELFTNQETELHEEVNTINQREKDMMFEPDINEFLASEDNRDAIYARGLEDGRKQKINEVLGEVKP